MCPTLPTTAAPAGTSKPRRYKNAAPQASPATSFSAAPQGDSMEFSASGPSLAATTAPAPEKESEAAAPTQNAPSANPPADDAAKLATQEDKKQSALNQSPECKANRPKMSYSKMVLKNQTKPRTTARRANGTTGEATRKELPNSSSRASSVPPQNRPRNDSIGQSHEPSRRQTRSSGGTTRRAGINSGTSSPDQIPRMTKDADGWTVAGAKKMQAKNERLRRRSKEWKRQKLTEAMEQEKKVWILLKSIKGPGNQPKAVLPITWKRTNSIVVVQYHKEAKAFFLKIDNILEVRDKAWSA